VPAELLHRAAAALHLVPAAADRLEGLGQHDFEVGQLLVDVVVGLGADDLRLAAGVVEQPLGGAARLAGHVGVPDDGIAVGAGFFEQAFGLGDGRRPPPTRGRPAPCRARSISSGNPCLSSSSSSSTGFD